MKMFCETELELKIIGLEQMVADRKMKGAKRINQVALSVYKDALKILREDKAIQEAWRREVIERELLDADYHVNMNQFRYEGDLYPVLFIHRGKVLEYYSRGLGAPQTKAAIYEDAKKWLDGRGAE